MTFSQVAAVLKGFSGENRPIRLRLSTEKSVADDILMVKHVKGIESLCGGLEYRLLCVATKAGLPLKQFTDSLYCIVNSRAG